MRDLESLPNELIVTILTFLPASDLARLSCLNSLWASSARIIFLARVRAYFGSGDWFYCFEANQPHEQVSGRMLRLVDAKSPSVPSPTPTPNLFSDLSAVSESVTQTQTSGTTTTTTATTAWSWWTEFEFSLERKRPSTYAFTLEPDTFIQLLVIGNLIEPQVATMGEGGWRNKANRNRDIRGLNRIVPHCDGYTRIKRASMADFVGGVQTFRVTEHVYLDSILLAKKEELEEEGEEDENEDEDEGEGEWVEAEAEDEGSRQGHRVDGGATGGRRGRRRREDWNTEAEDGGREEGTTRYEVEFTTLRVRTAELLVTLETFLDRGTTSTSLVLRQQDDTRIR